VVGELMLRDRVNPGGDDELDELAARFASDRVRDRVDRPRRIEDPKRVLLATPRRHDTTVERGADGARES
jgi:hypothetical protein